jgi:putative ABC transport system ATP-binding protein
MCATVSVPEAVYRLTGVSKTYFTNRIEVSALREIDFTIHERESIAVVGPSGSGKSTLLHILGTVDTPSSGTVRFGDQELTGLDDDRLAEMRSRSIGFVFQNYNLIPILSVFENVEYPLRIQRRALTKEVRAGIMGVLDEVGLADYARRRPSQLSGGQRQRVAIARALINDPAVILADEPTASLDTATSERILTLIRDLSARHRSTVVISTHDPQVLEYTGRHVHLRDGRITAIEGPDAAREN